MARRFPPVHARCGARPHWDFLERDRNFRTFERCVGEWKVGNKVGIWIVGRRCSCTPNRRGGARGDGDAAARARATPRLAARSLIVGEEVPPKKWSGPLFLTRGHCARFGSPVQGLGTIRKSGNETEICSFGDFLNFFSLPEFHYHASLGVTSVHSLLLQFFIEFSGNETRTSETF